MNATLVQYILIFFSNYKYMCFNNICVSKVSTELGRRIEWNFLISHQSCSFTWKRQIVWLSRATRKKRYIALSLTKKEWVIFFKYKKLSIFCCRKKYCHNIIFYFCFTNLVKYGIETQFSTSEKNCWVKIVFRIVSELFLTCIIQWLLLACLIQSTWDLNFLIKIDLSVA